MSKKETHTLFKTVKETHVVILRQPFTVIERYKSGDNIGKVKRRRNAQYCADLESIYVDVQKKIEDKPTISHIYFKKSKLLVPNDNITMLEALKNHEDNVANGGVLFKEVDVTQEQIQEIQERQKFYEVMNFITKADDATAKTMGLFFIGYNTIKDTPQGVILKLTQRAEENPAFVEQISKFSKEKANNEKIIVTMALTEEIITLVGKKFNWTNGNETIYISPQQKDAVVHFSKWMITDKNGRQVYSDLVSQLKDKLKEK